MSHLERAGTEPDVSGLEAAVAEESEALVLDAVANRVDVVVVVDHLLRAGEVGFDEGIGAGGDRARRERSQANNAERQLPNLRIEVDSVHLLIIDVAQSLLVVPFRLFARCSPSRNSEATASLRAIPTIRSSRTPGLRRVASMRRSFIRVCGIVLAAAAISVMVAGPATAASSSSTKLKAATLNADGATFPLGFYQVAIGAFKQAQHAVTINYQGVGSGQGRTDFSNKVTDFGASDAPYEAGTAPADPFMYFPTVVAPITVAYNLEGVKGLKLSPETTAGIFSAKITNWNDAAIKADNPKLKLPDQSITVVHRSEGSGTTQNFTGWLVKAAPSAWTLGTGSTVQWPASTQGAQGNPAVGSLIQETPGAVGYVDLSDANALDLTFASIKNATGKFVAPTLEAASASLDGLDDQPGSHVRPDQRSWSEGVPDHLADLDHGVHEPERREEGCGDQGVPELHLRNGSGRGTRPRKVGRLRPAVDRIAEAGQGPGQQDRPPPDNLTTALERAEPGTPDSARSRCVASEVAVWV